MIFGLSSIPGSRIPDVGVSFADKVAHVLVYGGLGALCFRGLRRSWPLLSIRSTVLAAALLALAYGLTDEFHQMFVPNRSSEFLDLVADLIGGTVGALVARAIPRLFGAMTAREPRP